MAAVDEEQRDGRAPVSGNGGRLTDHRDHAVLQAGQGERAPEDGQGVHQAELRVHQRRVVVLPACLVLLGAAVMVQREHDAVSLARGGAEVDRGLAAVGADLEDRPGREPFPRGAVQQEALLVGHEPLRRQGVRVQVGRHRVGAGGVGHAAQRRM